MASLEKAVSGTSPRSRRSRGSHRSSSSSSSSTAAYRQSWSVSPSASVLSSMSSLPKPSAKPPSLYHDYRGDVRAQDLFVDAIETQRRSGERHRVLFPGSDKFEMERMDVWNHDSICTPCLILQPKNSAEVSSCVKGYASGVRKCLLENRRTGSKLGIPRLCVAGGRNSCVSMMEGAVVLDLGRMKRVKVDAEARTVTVQGGARIADLDHELGTRGLMAVMGTHQNVGVVGCVLGGGVGYASRKHGLASDNVLRVKIVLADGKVRTCSPGKNEDLYWALRGGGGGIGVVTEITLKCYPLCNAALLTFDLVASSARVRRNIVENWSRWICGSADGDEDYSEGAPKEVYSQLILPTNSSSIPCICTSVDPEVIPQSEGRLEQFHDIMNQKSKKRLSFLKKKGGDDPSLPTCWSRVPGLDELKKNKFGASLRVNSKFQMVRYYDELQRVSEAYLSPGCVYFAYKYSRALSDDVVEVLVQATTGGNSPNNESRIFVTSAGCAINDTAAEETAFDAREMNFVIFIEGRWSGSFSENREKKERKKVMKWVNWVTGQLAFCEGIQSTTHPEASRDHLARASRSDPPDGHCNFSPESGIRLTEIKRRRDPKNVFSLASRVTWKKPAKGEVNDGDGLKTKKTGRKTSVKEGEVNADACVGATLAQASPRTFMERNEQHLSSRDVVDEVDEEEEESEESGSVHSQDSDGEPARLHYTSQRHLMGPPQANSARSVLTDLESIDEEKSHSPNCVSMVGCLDDHASSVRSGLSAAQTNSVKSMRSNLSDLDGSVTTDLDGFPIDVESSAVTEDTNFGINHDDTIDFDDDDAAQWSLPVKESTVSSASCEEGEESVLLGDMRVDVDHAEEYEEENPEDVISV